MKQSTFKSAQKLLSEIDDLKSIIWKLNEDKSTKDPLFRILQDMSCYPSRYHPFQEEMKKVNDKCVKIYADELNKILSSKLDEFEKL